MVTLAFGFSTGAMAFLPQGDPPDFILQATPVLHQVFASANGVGAWIPWGVAISTAGAIFALWVVLIVVSGVRWLFGWIPTMGGS